MPSKNHLDIIQDPDKILHRKSSKVVDFAEAKKIVNELIKKLKN